MRFIEYLDQYFPEVTERAAIINGGHVVVMVEGERVDSRDFVAPPVTEPYRAGYVKIDRRVVDKYLVRLANYEKHCDVMLAPEPPPVPEWSDIIIPDTDAMMRANEWRQAQFYSAFASVLRNLRRIALDNNRAAA